MADSSFDVVSEYDRQEVDNAVNQTAKEISQRYDFKGVGASVVLAARPSRWRRRPERVLAVYDVLQTKLVRRGVSLKSLDVGDGEPKQSGKEYRLVGTLRKGLSQDNAKRLSKLVREEGPKGVKVQIQGESLRGDIEVPRRTPGDDRPAQGRRRGLRPPVPELPVNRPPAARRPRLSTASRREVPRGRRPSSSRVRRP